MNRKMRGQSVLFTHTILLGFSIILIFVVIATFSGLRDNFQQFASDNEMKRVCLLIKESIEKAYTPSDYVSPTNENYSTIVLDLPEKLLGTVYRTGFVNDSVFVETFDPSYSISCKVGFNLTYTGSSTGGSIALIFSRSPDTMEMRAA